MGAHLPKLFCFLGLFESQNALKINTRGFNPFFPLRYGMHGYTHIVQPLLHHEEPRFTEYVSRIFLICQIATNSCYDYIIADLASDAK